MFSPVWANNVISFDPIANYSLTFALLMDLLPVLSCARILSIGTGQCSSVTWKKSNIQRCSWVGSSCMGKKLYPSPNQHIIHSLILSHHTQVSHFSVQSHQSPPHFLSFHIIYAIPLVYGPHLQSVHKKSIGFI